MENQTKIVNEPKNKNLGITITDSEVRRRLERFNKLIRDFRNSSRPEILPFKNSSKQTDKKQQVSSAINAGYYKMGRDQQYVGCKTILDGREAQRVYGTEGTSVTLKGLGGGQGAKTGLYRINAATKSGYSEATYGDGIRLQSME